MVFDIWRKRIGVVGRLKVFVQIISPDPEFPAGIFEINLTRHIQYVTYSVRTVIEASLGSLYKLELK